LTASPSSRGASSLSSCRPPAARYQRPGLSSAPLPPPRVALFHPSHRFPQFHNHYYLKSLVVSPYPASEVSVSTVRAQGSKKIPPAPNLLVALLPATSSLCALALLSCKPLSASRLFRLANLRPAHTIFVGGPTFRAFAQVLRVAKKSP